MKTRNFVSSIIWLVLSVITSVICDNVLNSVVATDGLESLALIVTVPLLFIFYLMLIAFLLNAVINTIFAITSDSKAIKIISVIMILIEIGLVLFDFLTVFTLLTK